MNYGGFILGCITVILILLIVCAFIYPNTIYDSSIILLTAISSIAWIIVYMSTRTLRCIQNDNPKELICKIGGNGRKYKIKGGIKGGINTNYYNTITGGLDSIVEPNKQDIKDLINFAINNDKNSFNIKWKSTIFNNINCTNQQDVQELLFQLFNSSETQDVTSKKADVTSLINSINNEITVANTESFNANKIQIDLNGIQLNNLIEIKKIIINNFSDYLNNILSNNDNLSLTDYMSTEFIYTVLLKNDKAYIIWFDEFISQLNTKISNLNNHLVNNEFKDTLNRNIIRLLLDDDGISIIEFYYSNLYKQDPYILLSIDNIVLASEATKIQNITKKFNINVNLDNLNEIYNKILLNNYEIIGIIQHTGISYTSGHYISYIKHNNVIYECNDTQITPITHNIQNFNELISYIDNNFNNKNYGYPKIRTILFKHKNIPYVPNQPVGLHNFGATCFANSVFQLLMATDLLDKTPASTTKAPAETAKTPAPTPAPAETAKTPAPIPASTPAITSTNKATSKIDNIDIEIIIDDIFNVKADAIVNPANIQLNNAGGLALTIKTRLYVDKKEAEYLKKITDKITENNKNNNRIFNTGDAIITKVIPENLEFKYVIHTPGPDFNKSAGFGAESYADKIDMGKEKLKVCMFNIMDQANKNEVVTDIKDNKFIKQSNTNQITSISIPMISSDAFAGDLDKEDLHKSIGKKYIEGIFEYLDTQPSKQNITKINFVIFNGIVNNTKSIGSYFNNFVQGFNEGINEYNNKTPATSTPVQQNKPQPPTPAKTLAPAETEEAPVQQPAQTPAQKEAQKVVQQAFNIAIQEVPQVQQTANNIVPQALNTATQNAAQKVVQQQYLDKINKWTDIINSNTVIKTDLKTQLIKYLNDNIKKKDVLKNIIYNLYNKDTIQNNDNYDKKRKYDEDKNPNLDLYKYYYDICKKYKTFLNNIQKINSDEYKRLNDVKIDKITEDNNDKITEEDNIKTSDKKMLDTPIFTLINDYTTYMERSFYERMIENSNLDIKDKNKNDRYDIQNLLPPNSRTLIYIFKKHKIAEKLNNFKLVYKLIEWSSILDKTTLNSLNNNDEGDELAEEENNDNLDNYEQDIVTDGDTSNQSIYYIQRKPIRDLIKTKFITDINDKNKLQNIIRRKAMRLFITFKKKIETDEESINNVDNQIQNFINFVNNPYITYDEEDFGSGEPYISYGSSYSSDSIKKISKRYGTDTTSFDKFYKELLHSEIL
jgi:O-acetyl-ADP-ribose deacetylase (regulator of RNase III)